MAEKEIITRAQAKELGLVYYFTGEPCKHGHVVKRQVGNSWCTRCEQKGWCEAKRKYRRKNPKATAIARSKVRAKAKGLPHTLTIENIPPIPNTCPYYGLTLEQAIGAPGDSSLTLDRIEPALGYTPDNVEWISMRANTHKSDSTIEEMRMMLARRIKMRDEA